MKCSFKQTYRNDCKKQTNNDFYKGECKDCVKCDVFQMISPCGVVQAGLVTVLVTMGSAARADLVDHDLDTVAAPAGNIMSRHVM